MLAVVTLTLAACGSRLDQDTIAQAAREAGSRNGTDQAQPGTGPGELGTGTSRDGAPGGTGDGGENAGSQGGDGTNGPGDGDGDGAAGGDGGDGGSADGEPIVIGSVGTLSGPAGAAFAQGAQALQAWAASINNGGGIGGRPVELIVQDDGGDPARSRSQVEQLVEKHEVAAIVGAMTLQETMASWQGYVEDNEVPVIGGDCSHLIWMESPMAFSQCASTFSNIFGAMRIGARHGDGTKLGGLFCTSNSACTVAEERIFDKGDAERAGLDPVYKAQISVSQPDFTSECIQARNAGVELMYVAADPNTLERVAASCDRQGFDPQFLQSYSTANAGTPGKTGLEDVLLQMPTFPFEGLNSQGFEQFRSAWAEHVGDSAPGPSASLGWAAGKLFEQAAGTAGPEVTRDSLRQALYGFDEERLGGLTVPLGFAEGEGTVDAQCTFFMQGADGGWASPDGDDPDCW
nr:ABC transporter substrate-binding protein [Haloechinothrix aidingensis]